MDNISFEDKFNQAFKEVSNILARSYYQPIVLGKDVSTGNLVTLEQEARLRGTYVIGKTGSGKTTLLINMILQDIEEYRGICFFDTHGDAIKDILARLPAGRVQDVILLDLLDEEYAFGLNLFQVNNPHDKQEVSHVVSTVIGVFAKLFTESGDLLKESPSMAETLQNSVPVLLAHQNPHMTMAEIPLLLMDETARTKLLAPLSNLYVRNFWNAYNRWKPDRQEELTGSTRRRVGNFLTDPLILEIIGQSETTLPFRKIMDERKILLVKLSRQHELISSLVGSVIIGQIANAAYSRVNTPEEKRVPFNLYADEYQRFSTPTFAELLAEVRKFKIATCIAHQWRSQLDIANRGATLNAANMVVYEVSGEDGEELAKQFEAKPLTMEPRLEPVRTPVTDPIGHLCSGRGSHPNPRVREFMPILTILYKGVHDYPLLEYKKCYDILNRILFNSMQKGYLTEPIPVEVFILLGKCDNYRYNYFNRCVNTVALGEFENSVKITNLPDSPAAKAYHKVKYCYDRLWGSTDAQLISDIEQAVYLCYYADPKDGISREETHKKVQAFFAFIDQIKDFVQVLALEPIEDYSGRYEEKPSLPEPIANAQMRVAKELANPKQKYTARCKLESGKEYTIQALPFRPSDSTAVVEARLNRIIAQTRATYCMKRTAVEAEIAKRQEILLKPEKPERKTKQEED